jgi:plastocyanin
MRKVLIAAGAAALAVVPAAPGVATKPKLPPNKVVRVGDDYFAPAKLLKLPRRTLVVWKWRAVNGNTHDVYLKSKPKGVKRFQSEPATADFTFKRRLGVKGTYAVICTFHEDMTMKITVR